MSIFVKKTDYINIDVYAYDKNGETEATSDKTTVSPETKLDVLSFKFRKPSYQDNRTILNSAKQYSDNTKIDPFVFQDSILRTLLVDWNLTDDNGEKLEYKFSLINELNPAIIRVVMEILFTKISF